MPRATVLRVANVSRIREFAHRPGTASQEAAFDVGTQLAARLAAVRAALAELQSLAQRLDAVAEERRQDVERWQGEAQPADARTAGYAVRQQQIEARLATLQLSPEVGMRLPRGKLY